MNHQEYNQTHGLKWPFPIQEELVKRALDALHKDIQATQVSPKTSERILLFHKDDGICEVSWTRSTPMSPICMQISIEKPENNNIANEFKELRKQQVKEGIATSMIPYTQLENW